MFAFEVGGAVYLNYTYYIIILNKLRLHYIYTNT